MSGAALCVLLSATWALLSSSPCMSTTTTWADDMRAGLHIAQILIGDRAGSMHVCMDVVDGTCTPAVTCNVHGLESVTAILVLMCVMMRG